MRSFSSFLLNEGGIGGHIPHPFELVSNGSELIDFYKKAITDIQAGYGMVKFDGVNTALKIVNGQFVMDRGSAKELDVKGIGPDDLESRFGKDHGMVPIGKTVLRMFNETMDETKAELAAMGLTDDSSLVLNIEYVKGKTNVVKYDGQYIVVHGIKKTSPKNVKNGKVTSRKAEDVEVDAKLLKKYVTKLNSIFKKKYEFRVVSNVESYFEQAPNLKKVLNKQIELNGESDTLSNWLSRYGQYKTPLIPRQKYQEYMETEKEIPEKDMPDVVIYTASIEMGDEILRNAVNLMQTDDQEGIVITPPDGKQYKITGSFTLRGLNSEFQKESLNEVFNTRVDWDRSLFDEPKRNYEIPFKIGKNEFGVQINYSTRWNTWEIAFAFMSPNKYDPSYKYPNLTARNSFENHFSIFGVVLDIVSEFINKYKPSTVFFTGEGEPRISLYDKLSKMMVKKFPYNLKVTKNSHTAKFVFTRKEESLNEVFNTRVDWDRSLIRNAEFGDDMFVPFQIGDLDYVVEIDFVSERHGWDISFGTVTGKKINYGLTGDLKFHFSVFATVIDIISEFVSVLRPKKFKFFAAAEGRVRLYDKIADVLLKKFPYTLEKDGQRNHTVNTYFKFSRTNPVVTEAPDWYRGSEERPREWGFYDTIKRKFIQPKMRGGEFFYDPDKEFDDEPVKTHNQLARRLGWQDKEDAIRNGLVSYETYSTGKAELDGWTDDQSTMMGKRTIAGMIEILRKLDKESPYLEFIQWTFYGKGLPSEAEGATKAIRMLKQRMKSSSLMKEWVELHEDFRTAREKFLSSGATPDLVDDVLTRFKKLSTSQKLNGLPQKNIDWWTVADPNIQNDEEKRQYYRDRFLEFEEFVERKEFEKTKTQIKSKKLSGRSYKLYENENWLVVVPLDHEASCFYGRHTDWCISKPNRLYYFKDYTERRNMMFTMLIHKTPATGHDPWGPFAIGWKVNPPDDVEFYALYNKYDDQTTDQSEIKSKFKKVGFPLSLSELKRMITDKLENIIDNGWGEVQDDEEYND